MNESFEFINTRKGAKLFKIKTNKPTTTTEETNPTLKMRRFYWETFL